MICRDDHRYLPILRDLPEAQSGEGRHKCTGCAYKQGYDHAMEGRISLLDADILNESQAGTGRHRDTQAAYELGFLHGIARRNALP